jgi:gamma-glutamylcyclotransferase (GGCT)/AIG2-like uncharacterized protein YtfP
MAGAATVLLFAYGTLRRREVQLARFGRELDGRPDRLPGYELATLEIDDAAVVELSGSAEHPIVRATDDPSDAVDGMVFELTEDELAAADRYEVDDYVRSLERLASGDYAWVYAAPR